MDGASPPSRGCFSRLRTQLKEPHGHSGHSYLRKFRFALSLFSLFHILAIIGSAKDVYLEKFGADATAIGLLFSVLSFWSPFTEFLVGHLQDRGMLSRFFPIERWGKRAPWLLTHCIIAACAASVVFMPPSRSVGAQRRLQVATLMLAYWGAASCVIAFESARQEIYPYKEERIVVEGLCKYTCMMGGGCGAIPVLVLLADASMLNRLAFVFYILLFGLVSLEAVPIFREAKVEPKAAEAEEPGDVGSVLDILREVMPGRGKEPNMAFRHLMAVKFWHGAYGASIGSTLFYYVTYNLRLGGWERMQVIVGGGLIAGVTEVSLNLIYMRMFSAGDGRQDMSGKTDRHLLRFVVFCRLCNAVATFFIIGWADASILMVFLWAFTTRLGLASFSFWRVSAQCWLVDEDCIFGAVPGRRRQGVIFGALAMTQNFAGAIFSSMTFLGLGLAGLETVNCEAQCKHLSNTLVDSSGVVKECIETCFLGVIEQQPDSLRWYVRAVIGMWAPLCELLIAFHAWKFPIKGARLRRLYAGICQSRGEEISLKPQDSGTPHTGRSKIVLSVEAAKSNGGRVQRTKSDGNGLLWRLAHTTAMVDSWPGAKSLSVFFDVNEAGPRDKVTSSGVGISEGDEVPQEDPHDEKGSVWAEVVPATRVSL
ncbi:unnamed protein product [Effrenium voratum]|uniref:Uncharacterized protein n=1 Tax=Effrenium voratum TaxID=2562239 RepID=A0AA36MHK1_9DINO|nr:unnamed protein product [Effrenium voratum]